MSLKLYQWKCDRKFTSRKTEKKEVAHAKLSHSNSSTNSYTFEKLLVSLC